LSYVIVLHVVVLYRHMRKSW